MRQGWEIKRLVQVCDFQNGFAFKSNLYKDTGLPILRITNIQDDRIDPKEIVYFNDQDYHEDFDKYRVIPNDLVIAMSGATTGKLGINTTEETFYLNQRVGKFLPRPGLLKDYLFYFLCTKVESNLIISAGAAQPNLSTEQIKNLQIPFPPLSEQHRIVAILDEAFAAIAKARENAERNLANTREVFVAYLQNVFTNQDVDWQLNRLGDVCVLKSGTTIPVTLERKNGDVLYVKIADMNLPENVVEIHTSSRFVNSCEINCNQIIPEGSVIFPKRGGAIATNKKRKIIHPTIVDLNTMALVPSDKIDKDFLFYWFQSIDLVDISNGTSIAQINNYSFDNVYIGYPKSMENQRAIARQIDILYLETTNLESNYNKKLSDLEELRKSILEKAFSGELNTN